MSNEPEDPAARAAEEAELLLPCEDVTICGHYADCPAYYRADVAAALLAAEQRGAEKAARWIEEPYPEDVFPPLTKEMQWISTTLLQLGPGLLDRLHAAWARHWAGVIREKVKREEP